MEPDASAGVGDGGGDGEQAQPEPFGFPPSRRVVGHGEHLHPGGYFDGEGDDGAPDLVLGKALQGEVSEAGVFADADAVLATGPSAVPQLQVRGLAAGPAARW